MINWKKLAKRIPNQVKFGKSTYEILWIDAFTDDETTGKNTLGETRFEPKQIVLKNNQPAKQTVHTYLHECFHAISEEYDVRLTEMQVENLEKAVKDLLKKENIFK